MTDNPASDEGAGQPAGPPQIIDNLFGSEVYADDVAFFAHKAGAIVSMQLVSGRFDANDGGKLKLVTVGRLIMPVSGAQGLAIGLFNYLKKNGLAPDVDPRAAN